MLKSIVFVFSLGFSSFAHSQELKDSCFIYIPNVYTVDGDCFDCDKIRVGTDCEFIEFNFRLFDRWGNLLFETDEVKFEYEPNQLKEGVYTYVIRGKKSNNEILELKDHLYFLR